MHNALQHIEREMPLVVAQDSVEWSLDVAAGVEDECARLVPVVHADWTPTNPKACWLHKAISGCHHRAVASCEALHVCTCTTYKQKKAATQIAVTCGLLLAVFRLLNLMAR